MTEKDVLKFFEENPAVSITDEELAKELGISLPQVRRYLNSLFASGKILRSISGGYVLAKKGTLKSIQSDFQKLKRLIDSSIKTTDDIFESSSWATFVRAATPILVSIILKVSEQDMIAKPFGSFLSEFTNTLYVTKDLTQQSVNRSLLYGIMSPLLYELINIYKKNPSFFDQISPEQFTSLLKAVRSSILSLQDETFSDVSPWSAQQLKENSKTLLDLFPLSTGYRVGSFLGSKGTFDETTIRELTEFLLGVFKQPSMSFVTETDVYQKLFQFFVHKYGLSTNAGFLALKGYLSDRFAELNKILEPIFLQNGILYLHRGSTLDKVSRERFNLLFQNVYKNPSLFQKFLFSIDESEPALRSFLLQSLFLADIPEYKNLSFSKPSLRSGGVSNIQIKDKYFELCFFPPSFFVNCTFVNCTFVDCYATSFNTLPLDIFNDGCKFDNCTFILNTNFFTDVLSDLESTPKGLTIRSISKVTVDFSHRKSIFSKKGGAFLYRIPTIKIDTDDQNKLIKIRQLREAIFRLLKERKKGETGKKTSSLLIISESQDTVQDILYIVSHKAFPPQYVENRSRIDELFRELNKNRQVIDDLIKRDPRFSVSGINSISDLFKLVSEIRKTLPKPKEVTLSKVQEFVEKYKNTDPLRVPKEEILSLLKTEPDQTPMVFYEYVRTQFPDILDEAHLFELLSVIDASLSGLLKEKDPPVYATGGIVAFIPSDANRKYGIGNPHSGTFYVALYPDPTLGPSYLTVPYYLINQKAGSHIEGAFAYFSVKPLRVGVLQRSGKKVSRYIRDVWYIIESQSDSYQKISRVAPGFHSSDYFISPVNKTDAFSRIKQNNKIFYRTYKLVSDHLESTTPYVYRLQNGVALTEGDLKILETKGELKVTVPGTDNEPTRVITITKEDLKDLYKEPLNPVLPYIRFFRQAYSQWPQVLLSALIREAKKIGIDQIWIPADFGVGSTRLGKTISFPTKKWDSQPELFNDLIGHTYLKSGALLPRKGTDRSKYYFEAPEQIPYKKRMSFLRIERGEDQLKNVYLHNSSEVDVLPIRIIDLSEEEK